MYIHACTILYVTLEPRLRVPLCALCLSVCLSVYTWSAKTYKCVTTSYQIHIWGQTHINTHTHTHKHTICKLLLRLPSTYAYAGDIADLNPGHACWYMCAHMITSPTATEYMSPQAISRIRTLVTTPTKPSTFRGPSECPQSPLHVCIYAFIYVCVCVYVWIMHAFVWQGPVGVPPSHRCMFAYVRIYIYIYIYIYMMMNYAYIRVPQGRPSCMHRSMMKQKVAAFECMLMCAGYV